MVSLFLLQILGNGPRWEDVSPNLPNGIRKSRASTAGLTLAVAGYKDVLYAVSLNAGVWRSDKGGPWHQLENSSASANCIAVDPGNPKHVVVGERNGFAIEARANRVGLQESFDAGAHWQLVFDPYTLQGCRSAAIPAVAFDRWGDLFIGTSLGIVVRRANRRSFDTITSPPATGLVTAISVAPNAVWARTLSKLYVTTDVGATWTPVDIPQKIGADTVRFASRGDAFSLAATSKMVVMPCVLDPGKGGNRNSLLAFDPFSKQWHTEVLTSGNGTGLGGRRFTKSTSENLLYGAGQEIHQFRIGPSWDTSGPIAFDRPVQTNWGGPYGSPPHEIHSDTWDMHLDPEFGHSNFSAWIACDGGIFEAIPALRDSNDDPSRLFNHRWVPRNDGLHTHHIHTITALEMSGSDARLAYPTSDNDAFYYDPKAGWMNEDWLGDVNWTAGDVGNPTLALMVRRSAGFAMLTAFRQGIPKGAGFEEDEAISLCNDEHYDGPTSCSFIQTLADEKPEYPLLDAVRLVDLPLKVYNSKGKLEPVSGPLGEGKARTVIIRNQAFAAAPDANRSKYAGWQIECGEVPSGSQAIWVSGGHRHPTYFCYANDRLYRFEAGSWIALSNESDGKAFDILPGNQFGPAFVNPFDPKVLFVLAKDGLKVSSDGGATFRDDHALTALVTENGKYPIAVGELTGNGRDVVLATRANSTATLAQVVFDRQHPEVVAACSPFTGVMVSNGRSGWKSLRAWLPKPLPPIVSIAIANDAIYCATEGRGVFRIRNFHDVLTLK